ncbi:hypothetical protein FOMPIDRAFT_1103409, partial [Fomitopsis schrenkii]
NERSHMRLVFETVGRPLSQFKSTKELTRGLRDAIYGHRQAYRAGIIHRDISENNVMLSDDLMSFFIGFLLDFDYGFNWKDLLKKAGWEVSEASWERYWKARMKFKERTGVMYFTAIEILITYAAHDVRHDLESFFWLLLWVVLRYTQTTCWSPNRTYRSVFGEEVEEESAKDKIFFLVESIDWEVVGNKPLATLFLKFKDLCEMAMPYTKPTPIPLTYESVLTLFHEALASMAWPQNDRALPFK